MKHAGIVVIVAVLALIRVALFWGIADMHTNAVNQHVCPIITLMDSTCAEHTNMAVALSHHLTVAMHTATGTLAWRVALELLGALTLFWIAYRVFKDAIPSGILRRIRFYKPKPDILFSGCWKQQRWIAFHNKGSIAVAA
ncbi:hypothetical protein KJZ71_04810 [Patescibacteria group bacterium]|jgi:hypothetical protein|uniref:Uncharacterized protein n=1 Tax=candidate division WWE3 bacterium TaxID=2053526 RepID=A0A928TSD1_UNCKA|nr:hypothetical protein [candidate division WWE3 bacterium]MCL4733089.1 hypothetical protein [Patescibacteria group bacterium]MDL1953456.1 hypothetical protein [Candidatus Uhrbacteria bacterium UHB]RIL00495.1 MAG: hypothetical protein DCC77_02940 [Candidatus Uhrbacteria bacterium]